MIGIGVGGIKLVTYGFLKKGNGGMDGQMDVKMIGSGLGEIDGF